MEEGTMNALAMQALTALATPPYVWIPQGQPWVRDQNDRVFYARRGVGQVSTAELYGRKYRITGFSGLGAAITGGAATADSIATAGASATVALLVTLGTVAGPIGAAIGGLIALASQIAKLFGGCGQTCVLSSDDANQVGNYMTQNLNTYLAAPVHYASLQAAALNNFDTAWASLVAACSNPQLGTAGQNCISEREQGACYWKASPGGWAQTNGTWTYTGYGPAGSGSACWNYFVGMRDPIANDPTVVPDPVAGSTSASAGGSTTASGAATGGTTSTPSPDLAPLLLIGGLIGLALLL
jgi:hypothetical protein